MDNDHDWDQKRDFLDDIARFLSGPRVSDLSPVSSLPKTLETAEIEVEKRGDFC